MSETKNTYNKHFIQLCIIKVALVFSVFSFSGFHNYYRFPYHESVKIELFELREEQNVLSQASQTENIQETAINEFNFSNKQYYFWVSSNFNQRTLTTYKSIYKKHLSLNSTVLKLPIKTIPSSSKSSIPPLSMA